MEIKILGAHSYESPHSGCISFLIDGTLAVDAGTLTSALPRYELEKIDSILLTHQHYDHIRDIPGIALNRARHGTTVTIYSTDSVLESLETHIFNGDIYPRFQEIPADKPAMKLNTIKPHQMQYINGYRVLPVPVHHLDMTVGYQIGNGNGNTVFYSADTGPGLAECWQEISPSVLIIDVTLPDAYEEFAVKTGHLTPNLLKKELVTFRDNKGYLPRTIIVHMDIDHEAEIEEEMADIASQLNIESTLAQEGMLVKV